MRPDPVRKLDDLSSLLQDFFQSIGNTPETANMQEDAACV